MKQAFQIIFLSLVLTAIAQAFWQHERLPEKVATHFDATGRANGWMSRRAQTGWHIGTVLFLAALFEGIALLQPRLPKEYVNIPHRDHWLAPERAAATHAWVAGAVLIIGSAMMAFFIALFHLLYQANLVRPPQMADTIWWFTGGLLALLSVVIAALLFKFGRKPTN